MKKLIRSKWFYAAMFICACALTVNVFTKMAVKRIVNEKRSEIAQHKVIDTKTVYENQKDEVSNIVKVEEEQETEEVSQAPQTSDEQDESFCYPVNGDILNKFSGSELVYSVTLKEYRVHNGIDIKAPMLSQVYAVKDGKVDSIKKDGLMGNTIVIDHLNGYKSVYSNLSSADMVKEGQSVKKGEIISGVGDTALIETGIDAHLHFELIKDGIQVNPEEYLNN